MIDLEKIKVRRAAVGDADWSSTPVTVPVPCVALHYDPEKCPLILQGEKREEIGRFIAYAPADIDMLVEEVEELKRLLLIGSFMLELSRGDNTNEELKEEVTKLGFKLMSEKNDNEYPPMPCGHPRSAIVIADDLGGPGTQSCGMCLVEKIDRAGGA